MAVTCVTQSHCSLEHCGMSRRWPVISLEAAGQASGWDGPKKQSWKWDPHLQWDTGWVCEVTSNSNTNNCNINEQTPLWCTVFYCTSVQGYAWSKLMSPEMPFMAQQALLLRVREWKLPFNLSVCPGLLHTASQVHIWIAVSCWGFSKLSWWDQTPQFGEGRICWKLVDMSQSFGKSSCLQFCNYVWMYYSPAQLLGKKGRLELFYCAFFVP